jgi:hypothetical protein
MSRVEEPVRLPLPQVRGFLETKRKDNWWVQPLVVFLGLSGFIVYSTWAALQGLHYFVPGTNYLSPMYSPVLFDSWQLPAGVESGHAWFGPWPAWLPRSVLLPLSPAFLILWAPGGFRFTCYYYRGAYYKAFWQDPTSCAVGEPGFRRERYRGERKWPLLLQNAHRYFFYIAVVFIVLLSIDAIKSYWFEKSPGHWGFGIGLGSLVLTINPILLGGYTFGCHVYRHLVGGRKDRLSQLGARKKVYDCVSCLNRRHMMWAWASLVWVGFTDLYVRMVSMGIWHDLRII